ncbi:MAG TPA: glycine betaine ABC transporter substrate-binding protein, partial [Solirubrobacteraceae bacterium]|nr:glycine betaine ABC transporter substrate-binding protein [Solirubrobacteraceae bacterium]
GHVAPIIDDETLEAHGPKLREAIDAISLALTTPVMRRMNAAVDLGGREPAAVAAEFLRARNLM